MTVEKDSHDKSLAALGEQVRSRFHDDWKKESLTVVDGLKKEFKENNRVGSTLLFAGFLLSVMSVVVLTGVLPTANTPDFVFALMTFLGALFLMMGVALKAGKKDILYMLDAESEIHRLNDQLTELESDDKTAHMVGDDDDDDKVHNASTNVGVEAETTTTQETKTNTAPAEYGVKLPERN